MRRVGLHVLHWKKLRILQPKEFGCSLRKIPQTVLSENDSANWSLRMDSRGARFVNCVFAVRSLQLTAIISAVTVWQFAVIVTLQFGNLQVIVVYL